MSECEMLICVCYSPFLLLSVKMINLCPFTGCSYVIPYQCLFDLRKYFYYGLIEGKCSVIQWCSINRKSPLSLVVWFERSWILEIWKLFTWFIDVIFSSDTYVLYCNWNLCFVRAARNPMLDLKISFKFPMKDYDHRSFQCEILVSLALNLLWNKGIMSAL